MASSDAPKPPGRQFLTDGAVLPAVSVKAPMPAVQPPKAAAPAPSPPPSASGEAKKP